MPIIKEYLQEQHVIQLLLANLKRTGETTEFIVKKTMKMEKLFTRYADKYNMDWRELRFLFDGERIQHDETPESATLEDGDQLQALLVQDGGFAFPLHRVGGVDEDGMDGGGSGGKTMKKGSGPKGPTETLESNLGKCCMLYERLRLCN